MLDLPDDDAFFQPAHAGALEEHDATLGGARLEQGLVALRGELSDVQGVETVHVLLEGDGQNLLLVHVLERELHEDVARDRR